MKNPCEECEAYIEFMQKWYPNKEDCRCGNKTSYQAYCEGKADGAYESLDFLAGMEYNYFQLKELEAYWIEQGIRRGR